MKLLMSIFCLISLVATDEQKCGPEVGKCPGTECCNKNGICGTGINDCFISLGCQPKYGFCEDDDEPDYRVPNKGENLTPDGQMMERVDYEKKIWDYLLTKLNGNKFSAAAVMGCFYYRSKLKPHYLSPACQEKFEMDGDTYTKKVDDRTQRHFVEDKCHYGLLAWSSKSQKNGLRNYARAKEKSIGDMYTQIDYLVEDMSADKFHDLYDDLIDSTDLSEAVAAVGVRYMREEAFVTYTGHFKTTINYARFYYNIYRK